MLHFERRSHPVRGAFKKRNLVDLRGWWENMLGGRTSKKDRSPARSAIGNYQSPRGAWNKKRGGGGQTNEGDGSHRVQKILKIGLVPEKSRTIHEARVGSKERRNNERFREGA